jgi:hypothetical protein
VVIVIVEVPEPVTDGGLKDAEVPVGNPLAPRVTVPLKLFRAVMVVLKVVLPPGLTVCVAGAAEIEKSGVAAEASCNVAACKVTFPLAVF